MMKCITAAILALSLVISPLAAQNSAKRVGEIKYVSQNSYYINLGKKHGLSRSDTLTVRRNGAVLGTLLVDNLANLSAACSSLQPGSSYRVGDRVEAFVPPGSGRAELPVNSEPSNSDGGEKSLLSEAKRKRRTVNTRRAKQTRSPDLVSGRLSAQTLFFDDQSGSYGGYRQLGLRGNLSVQQFLGTPFELRFRMRSRAHHRETALGSELDADRWTNSLYEMALVYRRENSPVEMGFGRLLSRDVRGLGYVDGAMVALTTHRHLRVGVVGGTQPSLKNSGFQTDEQRFGVFMTYENGNYKASRISSTAAFSGSYRGGESSREFIYFQNQFSVGRSRLSLYQTVEIDLNRGWKSDVVGSRMELSNFYASASYNPFNALSLRLSYDARKAVRVFETRSIPDSLFDESTRQGWHGGLTLQLPSRIRLSGNVGVRMRAGNVPNTKSFSGSLTIPHIFGTWTTLNARFSHFSTVFTKAYRPSVALKVPVVRGMSLNLGAGRYIYDGGLRNSTSDWVEANGYYRFSRRLFANVGYRAYLTRPVRSQQIFMETGIVF